jgi:hypothetical protein
MMTNESHRTTRITINMTPLDMVVALSGGNAGAITVCATILREGGRIDPDAWNGGLACLLSLDTLGIYGSDIWVLHSLVCGNDIVLTMAMLRATQLGIVRGDDLRAQVQAGGAGPIDARDTLVRVRAHLPGFAPDARGIDR